MPLYDLICIIKPTIQRPQIVDILKRTGQEVFKSGGVVTDITSYGTRPLAYDFKVRGEKHSEGSIVQMSLLVAPKVLDDLDHSLRVDERIMRWRFLKQTEKPSLKLIAKQEKKEERMGMFGSFSSGATLSTGKM
uniref:30S ribosomal protein S6, chloroplastic n=1 Tax=Pyramimonas obovata TaxID=1411642 RepID=A0A7S0RSK3_9CHLO|mmetsp:Transcript_5233/g.10666  ORF Transcript_5233/g.10666 Transcript_5233/m.10666 type:complete len:134 (+) Transcript_5233:319-720(+)|eukprot:CAMPEP_0118932686 /NCGR_PEP_ID=MMETSP1169-20130426/10565_1 /TAXON_ID=36882 /ORGANISM="Pyramimonas obovata, Strain CCMP722" /LENGTH=133 /DNA_ID=CAMNT_0006875381 /DNA_START=317 /DNA_END=718 /DNA_ORIENTATION=-